MDESPDWDEDALIDDYIHNNDEEEPPPPMMTMTMEEEYMEYYDELPPAVPITSVTAAKVDAGIGHENENENENVHGIPTNDNVNNDDDNNPTYDRNQHVIEEKVNDMEVDENVPISSIELDLYSYQRYSDETHWRTVTTLKGDIVPGAGSDEIGQKKDLQGYENKKKSFQDMLNISRHGSHLSKGNNVGAHQLLLRLGRGVYGGSRRGECRPWCFSRKESNLRDDVLVRHATAGDGSVPVTLVDGTRMYMTHGRSSRSKHNDNADLRMLSVSMEDLLNQAERLERDTAVRTLALERDDEVEDNEEDQANDSNKRMPEKSSSLWVDEHAPRIFSHLLSEERTNREVLRALRAWDPYVFKRAAPVRPTSHIAFMKKKEEERLAKGGKKVQKISSVLNSNGVKDERPDPSNRCILLCGQPGVGKTTLAIIAAKHAGYRPIEVNASDERSGGALKERIVNAMESTTLSNDPSMRGCPNCVILDEVDGADAKTAISTVVEIIKTDIPPKNGKSAKPYLRRPIIFICNYKYAPALRPLLPFARIFDVQPPTQARLVARLQAILNLEKLSCQRQLLTKLVNGSGGDIRSSLHTLQFSAARIKRRNIAQKGSSFTEVTRSLASILSSGGVSLKDRRSDLASILHSVFKKYKRNVFKVTSRDNIRDVERVLQCISNFDDTSKTIDSLFTNVIHVSYSDPTLDRCAEAHEWLSLADLYRSSNNPAALHDLGQLQRVQASFVSVTSAVIHFLCRIDTTPDLIFTLRDLFDCRFGRDANLVLLTKFLEGLSPNVRCNANIQNSLRDTIPYVLWLLSSGEGDSSLSRPVSSTENMKPKEIDSFKKHVGVLLSLGLTYKKGDANEDVSNTRPVSNGVYMHLEPRIDKLMVFNDFVFKKNSRRKGVIPTHLRELLGHTATLESMKMRRDYSSPQQSKGKRGEGTSNLSISVNQNCSKPLEENIVHDKPDILSPTTLKKRKRIKASSFLGVGAAKAKASRAARRAAMVKPSGNLTIKRGDSNTGSGVPMRHCIRFRYQKGFTQAVRVPCNINEFL